MPEHILVKHNAVAVGLVVAIMFWGGLEAHAQNSVITGVVKTASGEPVAGALVKVRNEARGLGFMVVSQAQGRYSTPNLLPGEYTIQAFGGTVQAAPGNPVEVSAGKQATADLVLSAPLQLAPRNKRMTDADLAKLLPEGDAKRVVTGKCGFCHGLLPVLSARKSRERWKEAVDSMYDDLIGIHRPLQSLGDEQREFDVVIPDYLAKNLGPNNPQDPRVVSQWLLHAGGPVHPNRNLPTSLLKGAAAKYVAMEFSLPSGSMPHDISVDSQGNAWVGERNTGMIGRFDPNSLTYTSIASPAGKNKFQLDSIAVDPRDQVWVADDGPNGRIVQYDPKGREFNTYPMPDYPFPVPDIGWARVNAIRFLNGHVFLTGTTSQRILRLIPATRKVIQYAVPRGTSPYGMAVGGDNMIWFSAQFASEVVRLDQNTDRQTTHLAPDERSDLRGMAADGEGNLWTAATEVGKILKMDYRTGNFTQFVPPTEDSGPYSVDVDTKRNLIWFSEVFADKIARFDPKTNTFVEFPHPNADSDVRRIEVDRNHPNRVWWASARGDKIGYIEVLE